MFFTFKKPKFCRSFNGTNYEIFTKPFISLLVRATSQFTTELALLKRISVLATQFNISY